MPWIHYERLNHRNCHINSVEFVKSIVKRPTKANLDTPDVIPIVKANLHIGFKPIRYYSCDKSCWNKYYCWGIHISVYLRDGQLYKKSGQRVNSFTNTWLLNRISKVAFS